jgi:hypothetical protein
MHPSGTRDQFFFLLEISFRQLRVCYFVMPSLMRGWAWNLLYNCFWALTRAVALRSKSRRTRNHILLFHLRLPQPGGPGPCIYIRQQQGGPVIPPGTGFPFCRLLRLAGLRRRYSNPPRHRSASKVQVILLPKVSRTDCLGVLPHLEQVTRCHISSSDSYFLYFSCWAPTVMRGWDCNLQCNDANSVSSYIVTDSLSASLSWCRHDQILIFFV